jgi:hypothetical protein
VPPQEPGVPHAEGEVPGVASACSSLTPSVTPALDDGLPLPLGLAVPEAVGLPVPDAELSSAGLEAGPDVPVLALPVGLLGVVPPLSG